MPKSTFPKSLMSSARRELQIIVVLTVAVFLIGAKFDVFEVFSAWALKHDGWRMDDLAMSFIFLAVAFCVFGIRRFKDLSAEIKRRELADAENRRGTVSLERNVVERTNELSFANDRLERELIARQTTEAAFHESEARYRQIVEAATDIIYRTDAKGNFTFVNPIAGRILKRSDSEILGKNFMELIRPDFHAAMAEFYQTQFDDARPQSYFEFPVMTHDGSSVWLGQNVQLLFENGKRIGYQAVARDITDRKRSEEAQRRAEEYRNLFQLANDSILILDPEGEIVLDVNDKACETYGLQRDEFIGRSLRTMSQDAERGWTHLTLLLKHGRYDEFETVQLRSDGTPIHFIINASVIEYQGRQAILSINRDITERARAEDERQKLQEQLRQSQKMESIGTLAGGVAHDFNNLLTAIKGYSDLSLRRLNPEDPVHKNLEQINKAADRSAALTRQLLAFSRLQRLESKPVNLNDLIGDLMKMLRRIIGEDVEVRLQAAPQLNTVLADPGQIEQVIMNLAVNARDAMPGGGLLTIETHNVELDEVYCHKRSYAKPGHYVQLMASDSGVGMTVGVRDRIFEPFFTTKEVGKGTGLGLATVYGVVKQHNGFIEVYSEPGQGTVFKVYLPAADAAVIQTKPEIQLPVPGGQEVVLIAEDEEALRGMTKAILEELGYEVLVAGNGQEAVDLYRAHSEKIDLLLFDLVMPRLGGFQAYEQIRTLDSTIPIVFMTGYSVALTKEFGRQNQAINEAGARVIQKPYSFQDLARPIREALDEAAARMPA